MHVVFSLIARKASFSLFVYSTTCSLNIILLLFKLQKLRFCPWNSKKGEKYWSLPRYCCTCCGFTYWNSLGHNFKHKNGANLRTQIFGETYRYCWIKFMFLFDCQHLKERSLTGQIFTSTKMYSFLDGSLFTRRNWSHIRKPYMLFIYSSYLFI